MAHTRRLADMLFGLATDAGTAGELRVYGLGRTSRERHRELVAELDRQAGARRSRVLARARPRLAAATRLA